MPGSPTPLFDARDRHQTGQRLLTGLEALPARAAVPLVAAALSPWDSTASAWLDAADEEALIDVSWDLRSAASELIEHGDDAILLMQLPLVRARCVEGNG